MALYHFSAYIVGRTEDHRKSAVYLAAYQAREHLKQEPTAFDPSSSRYDHDCTSKGGLVHSEIVLPKAAPEWAYDRERLWNEVHKSERRKDSQLAKWFDVALPHELKHEQRLELLRDFVRDRWVSKGLVADIALHAPDAGLNHHAHILISTRRLGGDGFEKTKHPEFRGMIMTLKDRLKDDRKAWADHVNRAYERAGLPDRVDERSYGDRLVNREPTKHMGFQACREANAGRPSRMAEENNKILRDNAEKAEQARRSLELDEVRKTVQPVPKDRRTVAYLFKYVSTRQNDVLKTRREKAWDERYHASRMELESRQLHTLLDLDRKHHNQKLNLAADQGKRNLGFKRTVEAEIDSIDRRLSNKGTTRFFRNLFGLTRRDERQRELCVRTLEGVAKRESEERLTLENAQAREKQKTVERFDRFRAKLEQAHANKVLQRQRNLRTVDDRDEERRKAAERAPDARKERLPPKPAPVLQPAPPKGAGPARTPGTQEGLNRKVEEWARSDEGRKALAKDPSPNQSRQDWRRASEGPVQKPNERADFKREEKPTYDPSHSKQRGDFWRAAGKEPEKKAEPKPKRDFDRERDRE